MVELYLTWVKDLPYDKEALKILKDSPIDGVEMRNFDEQMYNVLDAGLKLSLHNPTKESTHGLEDSNFSYGLYSEKGITKGGLASDAPVLGFHAGYGFRLDKEMSVLEAEKNTIKHLNDLSGVFNKRVVFELPSFHQGYIGKKNQKKMDSITKPSFIKNILSESDAGFLFDISHTFISGKTKEHLLGYYYVQEISSMLPMLVLKPKAEDIILDLCASPGSKTTQAAAMMENKGTIIANEVSLGRIRILNSNLERSGVMNRSNGTEFYYMYSDIIDGMHNLTVSCNDSLGNWGNETMFNIKVVFTDLTIQDVVLPVPIYSNSTIFYINVSNSAPLLGPIDNPIFICEGEQLAYSLNATDIDLDDLVGSISPQNPFYMNSLGRNGNTNFYEIISGTLDKSDVGNYSETISEIGRASCRERV